MYTAMWLAENRNFILWKVTPQRYSNVQADALCWPRPDLIHADALYSWIYSHLVVWYFTTWWRHQMEIFSALLAICAGNSPVPGEFPAQRPVTRSFDVFFDLRLNKQLSKQPWGWLFEKPSRPLWRHCNERCGGVFHELQYNQNEAPLKAVQ